MSNLISTKVLPALTFVCLLTNAFSPAVRAASPTPANTNSPSVSKLTVTVDTGALAKTTHTKVIPKCANVFDDIPFMNGEPQHVETTFDNDKSVDWPRKISVYPIAAYAQLFKKKEKLAFDKTVASLKSIIANGNADGVKELPVLPAVDMYEVFRNHTHILNCKNGKGVVAVMCYGQDEGSLSNGDFFYMYQGISTDGRYYVSVTYPVTASKLKKDTPPKAGKALIAGLKENEFTPNLNDIDKLIQSIDFK